MIANLMNKIQEMKIGRHYIPFIILFSLKKKITLLKRKNQQIKSLFRTEDTQSGKLKLQQIL